MVGYLWANTTYAIIHFISWRDNSDYHNKSTLFIADEYSHFSLWVFIVRYIEACICEYIFFFLCIYHMSDLGKYISLNKRGSK